MIQEEVMYRVLTKEIFFKKKLYSSELCDKEIMLVNGLLKTINNLSMHMIIAGCLLNGDDYSTEVNEIEKDQ